MPFILFKKYLKIIVSMAYIMLLACACPNTKIGLVAYFYKKGSRHNQYI